MSAAGTEPHDQDIEGELARLRSELQAAHQTQRQLEQQLEAARTGLADFASTVSHDLRANLRHINAFAGLLREELGTTASADAKIFLDKLSESARLMGVQMEGLMALTQIDRASLNILPVKMSELIERTRQSLAAEMHWRAIDWQIATDFPRVLADPAMVEQIWMHLLSNALKFTASRTPALIHIGWTQTQKTGPVSFFIQDNGVGFDPRGQDQLFKVFRRLHSASEFPGVGMGLALVRKIVGRLGGGVWIESQPDQGCRTSFSLLPAF